MKKIIFVLISLGFNLSCFSQIVTKEMPQLRQDSVKGACDPDHIYAIFLLPGYEPAKCPLSNRQIEKRLNSEISYLKENPATSDKGGLNLVINCKGEIVDCEMDIKTHDIALDNQICAVFRSLGQWIPAKVKGKQADSIRYWTFTIKNGRVKLDRDNF